MKNKYNRLLTSSKYSAASSFKLLSTALLVTLLTTSLKAQFGVTYSDSQMATYGDFTEVTPNDPLLITPPDEDFWSITTAPSDYDNDGDLDMAVLGYYVVYNQSVDYRLILIRNDGAAGPSEWGFSYFNVPLDGLSNGESDLAWGDMDGDGDQDLAMGTDGYTVIYRNDTGSLNRIETNLPAYWEENDQADFDLRSITWADFDNDGDLDLFIPSVYDASALSYYTALMRNDGPNGANGWNFTPLNNAFAPTLHAQSSWADFDNDQDLDLLLVNIAPLIDDSFIRRYRNDGNGIFTGEDILGALTVERGEAQWGDYDGDGDLDILVAGNVKETDGTYTPMALRIYRNDNENYVPVEVIADPAGEGWFDFTAATWADYDSDGDMDILLAGNYNSGIEIEGRARVYSNTDGVFTDSGNELPAPRASGDRGGSFSWFDLDGEGDLDYFIAGQYFVTGGNGLVEAQMHFYRNDVVGQNNAPSAPTGLNVTLVGENGVQLSWLAASDDHTPGSALTYELELFLNNIPVSIPARLPEPGNISAVTDWFLTGLDDGYYEWTLRAVDAAYSGSPVASGNFSIGTQTSTEETGKLNQAELLAQNYPNPFYSRTSIHFTVPESGIVSIVVYDLLGNEIKTLVDKEFTQGLYDVEFDATGVSPGVYFYRMTAGGKSVIKKMQVR
jgi:hypothetical protein